MRLNRLIDMDVENASGKEIGEIRDIIVDANNGRVQYAVLEYGGFLGMGEKLFPFPLSVFRTSADGGELVLDVPEDRLRKAPGFLRDKWPDWNAPDYRGTIDRYYESRSERVQNARFIRGSELLDADLRAKGGERIGEVEDVVANITSAAKSTGLPIALLKARFEQTDVFRRRRRRAGCTRQHTPLRTAHRISGAAPHVDDRRHTALCRDTGRQPNRARVRAMGARDIRHDRVER